MVDHIRDLVISGGRTLKCPFYGTPEYKSRIVDGGPDKDPRVDEVVDNH